MGVCKMLKLYNDTELYIDESQNKIIVTRGYWNFIRVNISYDNDKEKELIYRLFKDCLLYTSDAADE